MKKWGGRKTLCFQIICGPRKSKSRVAKAAGAESARQIKDEKLHALVAEAHLEVKKYKTPQLEVVMSKKCTPLWREARLEVNCENPTRPNYNH